MFFYFWMFLFHLYVTIVCLGNGRLTTAFCRLCHGKFSKRRLRHAFDKQLEETMEVDDFLDRENQETPLLFSTDFQRLLGVPMNRDPRLSSFICKTCHAQFYKCHRILADFRRRVNHTPTSHEGNRERWGEILKCMSNYNGKTQIRSNQSHEAWKSFSLSCRGSESVTALDGCTSSEFTWLIPKFTCVSLATKLCFLIHYCRSLFS